MNSTYRFNTPKFMPLCRNIIITYVALFLVSSILHLSSGFGLEGILGLRSERFFSGHFYQVLTYPFIGNGLFEVIFDALMVWFVGCELEALWGTFKFIMLFIVSAVISAFAFLLVGGLFPSLSGISLTGLTGFCNALLVAYAYLYSDRYFSFFMIFPIKAKWFCFILIGMLLYTGIFSPGGVQAWGHLGGMLAGYIFVRLSGVKINNPLFSFASKKKKGHLKLVKDKDDNQPKYWQ